MGENGKIGNPQLYHSASGAYLQPILKTSRTFQDKQSRLIGQLNNDQANQDDSFERQVDDLSESEPITQIKKKRKIAKFEELKEEEESPEKDESLSPVNNKLAGTPPKKGARKLVE